MLALWIGDYCVVCKPLGNYRGGGQVQLVDRLSPEKPIVLNWCGDLVRY